MRHLTIASSSGYKVITRLMEVIFRRMSRIASEGDQPLVQPMLHINKFLIMFVKNCSQSSGEQTGEQVV